MITPSIGDARKLSISALQSKGLQVGKPAAFVVNFNGAKGKLKAKVVTPSLMEDEALIQEIDEGKDNVMVKVHIITLGVLNCHQY